MKKRKNVRGLIVSTVSLVVILAAALIVHSLAAGDPGPSSSSSSFALPAEPDSPWRLPPVTKRTAAGAGRSSAASASPSGSHDTSAHVAPGAVGSQDGSASDGPVEDLRDGQAESQFSPLADSGSWPQTSVSPKGYGSESGGATAPGGRPRSSPGYFGTGGGGGFPSGGGGTPNAQNSLTDPGSTGPRSPGEPTASLADAPLLPPQAQGNPFSQAQGNPLSGVGTPPVFGLTLTLAQTPGRGAGAAANLNAGGSTTNTASVTQSQEPVAVPEPSTVLLLGCGAALAAYRTRRRRPLRS